MKFVARFDEFMKDIVNLNQTRYDEASTKSGNIADFLRENILFKDKIISIDEQGSFRHKTIIKPQGEDGEFDVDILMVMKEQQGWQAKDYINKLSGEFSNSGVYKDKVQTNGKTRCVTIDYTGEFHVDVVPCKKIGDNYYIMNKKENVFEQADGDGYAEWFQGQNTTTGGKLKKVIRLLKYLRDNGTFALKSVVLTTLVAKRVVQDDDLYVDLPTALYNLIKSLDAHLQANPLLVFLDLSNPALPTERFDRNITQESYNKFRDDIHSLNTKINNAYKEEDKNQSMRLWREIFGEDFGYQVEEEETNSAIEKTFSLVTLNHVQPITKIATSVKPITQRIRVDGHLYTENKKRLGGYNSDTRPIPKGLFLKFYARNLPHAYDYLYWQVVNTGSDAASAGDLRGNFDEKHINQRTIWEHTKYRGKHWVQCFAVKGGEIIAASEKFYIKVK